ncbi:MAG: c-type cytochrome biogenesis protein CcmI [Paracoccaceae bacterium]
METIWFWTVAVAMTVIVAAFLIRSLVRPHEQAAPAAVQDMQVYRDQLAEADRDLARGTLSETEAQRLKTEIARRLLEADRALQTEGATPARRGIGWLPVAVTLVAGLAALALYNRVGLPWYPDLPIAERIAMADEAMATRPSQAVVEASTPAPAAPAVDADFTALMDKLRAAVDPATATDLRGLDLLARNEAALGNFAAAQAAQRRIIALQGDAATAEDYAGLAEIMIRATGGYVSPEAEVELVHALERDPRNGSALFLGADAGAGWPVRPGFLACGSRSCAKARRTRPGPGRSANRSRRSPGAPGFPISCPRRAALRPATWPPPPTCRQRTGRR